MRFGSPLHLSFPDRFASANFLQRHENTLVFEHCHAVRLEALDARPPLPYKARVTQTPYTMSQRGTHGVE
eukprot:5356580-Prymnesium_polylepis.1